MTFRQDLLNDPTMEIDIFNNLNTIKTDRMNNRRFRI